MTAASLSAAAKFRRSRTAGRLTSSASDDELDAVASRHEPLSPQPFSASAHHPRLLATLVEIIFEDLRLGAGPDRRGQGR